MDIRPKELSKIEWGKRHFKGLGSEIKVADTIRDLNFHSSPTAARIFRVKTETPVFGTRKET